MEKEIYKFSVKHEWIDYNGHMNDGEYAKVFSLAVDEWMKQIGLGADFRNNEQYTLFTLEMHLNYLKEVKENEHLTITLQLLDYDLKRAHVFLVMQNVKGDRVATSEQMLMGMDTKENRPAPFPRPIINKIKQIAISQNQMKKPKEASSIIGIPRK